MNPNTFLEKYQILLPWNLARTKCFVNMILGVIASGSVHQHKTALGFAGSAKQASVCSRIRNFLKSFKLNYDDYARAILEIAGLKGPLPLALDHTNWKSGRIDINLLVLAVVITDQFSVPLFWRALPKKGNSNAAERIDLLLYLFRVNNFELTAQMTVLMDIKTAPSAGLKMIPKA